ncbi:MAG: aspartate--tRNA ligase, partial [Muribaculaceae bacterium]|nr:aspartate--tRNA ligase [Muribaculaceae bacterium]
LMVSGFDRYFQIAKCFRDEDLRADRQPEFTQIDCEMSFVEQEDVIEMFEGLVKHIFKYVKGIDFCDPFPRMTWNDAMRLYGSDKPDIRFGMPFVETTDFMKGKGFSVVDEAEICVGITAPGCASYTRKQLDELTDFVKRPQIGAKGLIWIKAEQDGSFKSSIGKFYSPDEISKIAEFMQAKPGDLMLIMTGEKMKTRKQLCELRLEMGNRLGLRDKNVFAPLWIIDFPLFEWDDETQRFYAMHHPFTSPNPEDICKLRTDTGNVRATAYDIVVNGTELGGGSIRIHDAALQDEMFELLGFTQERAQEQFGFLMNAFKYGAPPHGGLALGFDRFVSILAGLDTIRDVIAFPKNNSGRDVMNESPSPIDQSQLDELFLELKPTDN